jgi:tetrapyrrole methylase family protein/MazG family protein
LDKFEKLKEVISALRDPETGCPWDLKQNLESLTRFMSEESSEYISAVASGNPEEIKDELGDVLLQVVLNAKVAEQEGLFDIDDVVQNITDKMIRRHPHVFADTKVNNTEEVISNWDAIKQQENPKTPLEKLFDISKSLSALMEADQIGRKSKKVNFDWPGPLQVLDKVKEELGELEEEIHQSEKNQKAIEHELGDLLFSCVQLARHMNVNPELALKKCNERFYSRFTHVAKLVEKDGRDFTDFAPEELEKFWVEAKKLEK